MKKGVFTVCLVVFLIGFVFSASSTDSSHRADEVVVSVGGYEMNLQEAFDGEFLKDNPLIPTSNGITGLAKTHSGDKVQIYLKDVGRISLQEAITQKMSLCRETPDVSDWLFDFGHRADEILFNDNQTLQEKINTQQFCNYHTWAYNDWSECSVNCGEGTQTRTAVCKIEGLSEIFDDIYCSDFEAITEQSCTSGEGTSCGFSGWSSTSVCSEGTCGTGTYKRTRTCEISSEYCNGPKEDFNGGSCSTWSYSWTTAYHCSFMKGCRCQIPTTFCQRCDGAEVSDGHCSGRKPSPGSKGDCSSGGGGGGTSVLCTEAYNQGYLSDELYNADILYSKENVDEITLIGYHSWAEPLVRIMKDSPEISNSAMPLIVEWAKQMAYLMGVTKEGSEVGKVLIDVGMPVCNKLGILLVNDGYSKDNKYEFDEEFVKKISLKYIEKGIFSIDNLSSDGEEKFRNDLEDFFSEIEAEFFLQKYL